MVAKGFTPRQVTAIEPLVREFVIDRIEGLRAQGGGDVMAALFEPLPTMVVAEYLGVPETVSHLPAAGLGGDGDVSGARSILGFAFTMVTGVATGMCESISPAVFEVDDDGELVIHLNNITAGSCNRSGVRSPAAPPWHCDCPACRTTGPAVPLRIPGPAHAGRPSQWL